MTRPRAAAIASAGRVAVAHVHPVLAGGTGGGSPGRRPWCFFISRSTMTKDERAALLAAAARAALHHARTHPAVLLANSNASQGPDARPRSPVRADHQRSVEGHQSSRRSSVWPSRNCQCGEARCGPVMKEIRNRIPRCAAVRAMSSARTIAGRAAFFTRLRFLDMSLSLPTHILGGGESGAQYPTRFSADGVAHVPAVWSRPYASLALRSLVRGPRPAIARRP